MKGIFDPYSTPEVKPKRKDFTAPVDRPEKQVDSNISLDGDTYIIEFQRVKVADVAKRLGLLFLDLNKIFREELNQYGVSFYLLGKKPEQSKTALLLPTPSGVLMVETGEDKSEIAAYRRLGYALSRIPAKDILKKHAIRVYTRG